MSNTLKHNTQYKWETDSQFSMTGTEFTAVFNSLNVYMATPDFQTKLNEINTISGVFEIMKKKLADAVESGVAHEVPQESVSNTPTDAVVESQVNGN